LCHTGTASTRQQTPIVYTEQKIKNVSAKIEKANCVVEKFLTGLTFHLFLALLDSPDRQYLDKSKIHPLKADQGKKILLSYLAVSSSTQTTMNKFTPECAHRRHPRGWGLNIVIGGMHTI
jgi:hypothetical protein